MPKGPFEPKWWWSYKIWLDRYCITTILKLDPRYKQLTIYLQGHCHFTIAHAPCASRYMPRSIPPHPGPSFFVFPFRIPSFKAPLSFPVPPLPKSAFLHPPPHASATHTSLSHTPGLLRSGFLSALCLFCFLLSNSAFGVCIDLDKHTHAHTPRAIDHVATTTATATLPYVHAPAAPRPRR